ncbi:MAG: arylsulfatase [Bacteroidota bacterium]
MRLVVLFTFVFTGIHHPMLAQERPNVIVVLADDVGVGDISHYRRNHSDKIIMETPAIDQLAKEGLTFSNAYAPAALCAPSRYAIMTGNHCFRSDYPWGVWGSYQKSPIKEDQLTLGRLMKEAGYQTAFFGKWHLGGDYLRKDDSTTIYRGLRNKPELDVDIRKIVGGGPQSNGFDYSYTFPAGIQAVPYAAYENGIWLPFHEDSKVDFITQKKMTKIKVKLDKLEGLGDSHWNPHRAGPLLVNKAVDFLEKKTTEQPFFLYYCAQAVHLPHTPSDSLNGKKIKGTTPSRHLDMVKELDVQIEMMVATLKRKGIYENTLIIITSDNGGLLRSKTIKSGHQSNDIYRGGKNQPYEGGNRVPFIATWPEKIKANRQSDIPVLGLDIMATLGALTDQNLVQAGLTDGRDLLPIFYDEKKSLSRPFVVTQAGTGKQVMIRKAGWKLIIQTDKKNPSNRDRKPVALFDLKNNATEEEQQNLINSKAHQAKVQELLELYNATRDKDSS